MGSVIGGPCYAVMFGPFAPQDPEGRDFWKRTTLAFMGGRSRIAEAKSLGVRFAGAHTRAIYSRLATGDRTTLGSAEAKSAYEWGDWGALAPEFWRGPVRVPGEPERDMNPHVCFARSWPYHFVSALSAIYTWNVLSAFGLFLDADMEQWESALLRLASIARSEGIPVYLNGGTVLQYGKEPQKTMHAFDGVFYEAVHVGKPYEGPSTETAERFLSLPWDPKRWVGIQVRFMEEPSPEELSLWSRWFLQVRRNQNQSVTFVVQPEGQQPRELRCPPYLDPGRAVTVRPIAGR